MKFRSIKGQSPNVGFRDALFRGLAPDGSLYVPESLPPLPHSLCESPDDQRLTSIAQGVLSHFIDDIEPEQLKRIVDRALDFPVPLVHLENSIFLLELFHGPTLAFKDVGARFMAGALSHFLNKESRELTIVVATSGDTGSAVAHGFFGVPHITVYVLYPSGKISALQEQQMATLGGNIKAVEVLGTFDECQHLVKECLNDKEILQSLSITTANSINVGRLLPQISYYVWGLAQLKEKYQSNHPPIIVVPSGNFGNLTAAMYAKRIGAPIATLVAATNINDVVPEYLRTGVFVPRGSVQTLSNAMDVGDPSNLARIQSLYGSNVDRLRNDLSAMSITDDETLRTIKQMYERTGQVLDPHTAVGVASAMKVRKEGRTDPIIVPATAHAGKFQASVERALGKRIRLPERLLEFINRPKLSMKLKPSYEKWKELLLQR